MKIQENIMDKKKVIQIYLTEEEKNKVYIQQKIEHIKENYKVVLFVSGDKDVNRTLNNIIKITQDAIVM